MQRRPGLRGLGLRALLAWWLLVGRMQHTGHRGLLPVPQLRNNSRAYPPPVLRGARPAGTFSFGISPQSAAALHSWPLQPKLGFKKR
jgi:hypothetical protein